MAEMGGRLASCSGGQGTELLSLVGGSGGGFLKPYLSLSPVSQESHLELVLFIKV